MIRSARLFILNHLKRLSSVIPPTATAEPRPAGSQIIESEASLRERLDSDPENADLLQQLCTYLTEQGTQIPLELEERTLTAHLKRHPDRGDLQARLDQVRHMLGKLSRDRENERRLAEYRARGFLPPNLYVQMCGHKNAIKERLKICVC